MQKQLVKNTPERIASKVLAIISVMISVDALATGLIMFLISGFQKSGGGRIFNFFNNIYQYIGMVLLVVGFISTIVNAFALVAVYSSNNKALMIGLSIPNIIFVLNIALGIMLIIVARLECTTPKKKAKAKK